MNWIFAIGTIFKNHPIRNCPTLVIYAQKKQTQFVEPKKGESRRQDYNPSSGTTLLFFSPGKIEFWQAWSTSVRTISIIRFMKFGIICFLGDKKESALAFFQKRHLDGCVNCTIVLGDFLCPLRGARLVAKSKQGDVAVLAAGRGREAGQKTWK